MTNISAISSAFQTPTYTSDVTASSSVSAPTNTYSSSDNNATSSAVVAQASSSQPDTTTATNTVYNAVALANTSTIRGSNVDIDA